MCACLCVFLCSFSFPLSETPSAILAAKDLAMGWLRLVISLKLYVSLENISLFCRALLQKRPIILRSLLIVATPQQSRFNKVAALRNLNATFGVPMFAEHDLHMDAAQHRSPDELC